MSKWTPRPWEKVLSFGGVVKNGIIYPLSVDETRNDGESWLEMRARTAPDRDAKAAEEAANSQLQKTAPDLYDAVAAAESWIVDGGYLDHRDPYIAESAAYIVAQLRSVMAKARGEEPT